MWQARFVLHLNIGVISSNIYPNRCALHLNQRVINDAVS